MLVNTVTVTVLLTVGGLTLFVFREDLFGASKTLLVGIDAHQRVVSDATTTIRELTKMLNSVQGSRSRASVASAVESKIERLKEITERAANLPRILSSDLEHHQQLMRRLFTSHDYGQLQRSVRSGASNKLFANDRFGILLKDVQPTVDRFIETCNVSWRPHQVAVSETEQAEQELVDAMQQVWATLNTVDSRSSFSKSAAIVHKANAYLQHVMNVQGSLFIRQSTYHEAAAFYFAQISHRIRALRVEYGGPHNGVVFDEFVETLRSMIAISLVEAESSAMPYRENSEDVSFGRQYVRFTRGRTNSTASTRRVASARSPSPGERTKDRTGGANALEANEQEPFDWKGFQRSFEEKWPEKKIAAIWVHDAPGPVPFRRLTESIRSKLRPRAIRVKVDGDLGLVLLTYSGSMRSLAEQLEWANDITLYEQGREVTVTYQPIYGGP